MPIHTVAECVEEAVRLLAESADAFDEQQRLGILRRAAAWLEIAKYRAAREGDEQSCALPRERQR